MAKFCGKCGSKLNEQGKCPNCKTEESKLFSLNTVKQKPWIGIVAIVLVLAIVVGTISIISVCFRKDDPKIDNLQLPIVGKFTDKKITDGKSAIKAVQEIADDLGLENAAEELTVKREDTVGELTYYRLQQNYKGIPVYGSDFVVIADENGEAKGLTHCAIDVEIANTTPTVDKETVQTKVDAYFNTFVLVPELENSQLIYYYNKKSKTFNLSYVMKMLVENEVLSVIVDANTGAVLQANTTVYTNIPDVSYILANYMDVYDADGKTIHKITKTIKKGEDYDKDVIVKQEGTDATVTTPVKKVWEKTEKTENLPDKIIQAGATSFIIVIAIIGTAVFAISRYRKIK
jgi:Zn-dependent metalloprotease